MRKEKGKQAMTVIPIYRPYVFLRCGKCGRKTDHVLINTDTIKKDAIEETYECQQCGETKKIYELASIVETQPAYSEEETTSEDEELAVRGLEEKVKAKRQAMEQLESKKKDLEERLKMTTNVTPSDNQQPKQTAAPASQQPRKPEEQKEKQQEKKKRKWF